MKKYLLLNYFFLAFVGCSSSQENPLLRQFPINGESYCQEFKRAMAVALSIHLTKQESELPQLFRATTNKVVGYLQSQTDSRWEIIAIQDLREKTKFVSVENDLESFEDCRFQVAVNDYIAARELQQSSPESPYVFQLFLWAFAQQLDYFSYTNFERNQKQARSFGLKVDFDLASFYGIPQTKAKVVHSLNDDISSGSWLYGLEFPPEIYDVTQSIQSNYEYRFKFSPTNELHLFDSILNHGQSSYSQAKFYLSPSKDPDQKKVVSVVSKPQDIRNSINVFTETSKAQIYIRLFAFEEGSSEVFENKLRDAIDTHKEKYASELASEQRPAIVLDLRNNPGGLTAEAYKIASLFLNDGEAGFNIDKEGNLEKILIEDSASRFSDYSVVILVNHLTASSGEILTQILSEFHSKNNKRALVVGEKTFGKGIFQVPLLLNNLRTQFYVTAGRFFGPNGKNIQEVGVSPEIEVVDPLIEELRDSCRNYSVRNCRYQYMIDIPSGLRISQSLKQLGINKSISNEPALIFSNEQISDAREQLEKLASEYKLQHPAIEERFDYQREFASLLISMLFTHGETSMEP